MELQLTVPTLFGIESVAADEIRDLGYRDVQVEDGRVSFRGDESAICRCNLWLRTAERVQIKMGDFKAYSFDELFEGVKALPWHEILPVNAVFPVSGHCLSSKLYSVPDCQAIIKKAIVEEMKPVYRKSQFPEDGGMYRIQFNIIRDRAILCIDTSGAGLHKRGYREDSNLAPIKETLAAGMVRLARWRPGFGLWDPLCGSGTIVIEAALMMLNMAPGMHRSFAAESWPNLNRNQWEQARSEAADAVKQSNRFEGGEGILLAGSDIDKHAVDMARLNAKRANVSKYTKFFRMAAREIGPNHSRFPELGIAMPQKGSIICNPPYAERMSEKDEAAAIFKEMGSAFAHFNEWNWYIINAHEEFERYFGRKADKKRKLYNGMIRCNLYQYFNR